MMATRPTLHQLFETTAQPGLTEVLLGEVLEDAVPHLDRRSRLPARGRVGRRCVRRLPVKVCRR